MNRPAKVPGLERRRATFRLVLRILLVCAYLAAGVLHLGMPAPFEAIMPRWVPLPEQVIALTGAAEIVGAAALLQPWSPLLRSAAGWGLAAYALCVWPANVQHLLNDLARPDGGLGLTYHVPRLAAQPLLIWLALWTAQVTDWPFRRRG